MLRAQLRSEGIEETDIDNMLGESPSKVETSEAQRPLPSTLFPHSDSGESSPMDEIPSIDFTQLRAESQASQPPASDIEISEEERQLNDAIYKSLSEK